MKKQVAVALSGGVDSLVSAFLLKKEYPNIFGIYFITGYEASLNNYTSENRADKTSYKNLEDKPNIIDILIKSKLENLKEQLKIPIYSVDLREEFEKEVVSYFIETYKKGKTPNPCIICNKNIKFGALYKAARNLGADILATGHYAKIEYAPIITNTKNSEQLYKEIPQISKGLPEVCKKIPALFKGKDRVKDQSYFLSMLSHEQLNNALFPLGDFTKQEVIKIAGQNGLIPFEKKESQDICFINKNSFGEFIEAKLHNNKDNSMQPNTLKSISTSSTISLKPPASHCSASGDIVNTDNKIIGKHKGLHRYTIGQRKGLNCPGPAPYYVKQIDIKNNRLVVGFKQELFQKEFYVNNINWLYHDNNINKPNINYSLLSSSLKVTSKIRYSDSGAWSVIVHDSIKNHIKVIFDEPQLAVTPGQCAVFYDGDKVLGAGFIQ